tara:strand:+ start:2534 stop:3151 length:618 start_codon:yes stop_codon:yes gene_type:complete
MVLLRLFLILFIVTFLFSLQGCVSAPTYAGNACSIFDEKYFWFKAAKKSSEKWKVPIATLMSVINQESAFKQYAKPPRKKLFGFIPLITRESSSLGYSQATKSTWEHYKNVTGKRFVTRIRFKDSVDFVGFYIDQANKELGISKKDTYSLYLAYHEGMNGFRKKTYNKKPKLLKIAIKVDNQAKNYNKQLSKCMNKLDRNKYILF